MSTISSRRLSAAVVMWTAALRAGLTKTALPTDTEGRVEDGITGSCDKKHTRTAEHSLEPHLGLLVKVRRVLNHLPNILLSCVQKCGASGFGLIVYSSPDCVLRSPK